MVSTVSAFLSNLTRRWRSSPCLLALAASALLFFLGLIVWSRLEGDEWRSFSRLNVTVVTASERTVVSMDLKCGSLIGPWPLVLPPLNSTFKIWIYPFADDFLRQGRLEPNFRVDGVGLRDPGYVWEVLLADVMQDPRGPLAPYITSNPEEATLRLVPMYPTALMHTWEGEGVDIFRVKVVPLVWNILNRVQFDWPYWNATQGTDHIYIMSHDNGLVTLGNSTMRSMVSSGINVQPLGSYRQWDGFRSNKDVVVPPYETNDKWRRRALRDQIPSLDGRKVLCAFKGSIMLNNLAYSSGVRQFVYKNYNNATSFAIYDSSDPSAPEYRSLLDDSIFCLYLPGWPPARWSGRLIHLLMSGCIPVIIVDDLELPMEAIVDWSTISVRVTEAQLYAGFLPDTLQGISQLERISKAAAVRQAAALFSSPYSPNSGVERSLVDVDFAQSDALNVFHLVLGSLYARARRLGLLRN